MRLLLVEDDARIARFVAKGLREQAYAVDVTANGDDALYEAAINSYDLVILDVMIPGKNGFEVCRELRRAGQRMPILMLTARDAVEDRITGLDHGADDYLTNCWRGCARYCGAQGNCGRRKSRWRTWCWIRGRRPSRGRGATFRSLPKSIRCWNFWRATRDGWWGERKLRNTCGTRALTRFRT
jgi:CheY-like chemotaxis protein